MHLMRMKISSFWVSGTYGGVQVSDQQLGLLGDLAHGVVELGSLVDPIFSALDPFVLLALQHFALRV